MGIEQLPGGPYQPTPEEIKKAKGMMSTREKQMSRGREQDDQVYRHGAERLKERGLLGEKYEEQINIVNAMRDLEGLQSKYEGKLGEFGVHYWLPGAPRSLAKEERILFHMKAVLDEESGKESEQN